LSASAELLVEWRGSVVVTDAGLAINRSRVQQRPPHCRISTLGNSFTHTHTHTRTRSSLWSYDRVDN